MYNPNVFPHSAPPAVDAVYHPSMIPSTSNFPSDMSIHAMPSAYSKHDVSALAADVSADATNNDDDPEAAGKRRRVQRACDTCRKKKVRCDGLQPDKGACTNCANYNYECTFVDAARKRAPPRSYVEAIEARIVKMEQLIASLAPGVDFTDRIGKPIRRPDEKPDEPNIDAKPLQEEPSPTKEANPIDPISLGRANTLCGPGAAAFSQMLSPSHSKSRNNSESDLAQSSEEDSDDDIGFIQSNFSEVRLQPDSTADASASRFDSQATERLIVGNSKKIQDALHTAPTHKFIGKASAMHSLPILERLSSRHFSELGFHPKGARQEYWNVPSGFMDPLTDKDLATSAWPDPDLADMLIDAYFGRMNREFPVINEFQYRHEYANKPELRNEPEWIALSFCIFMLGSHYVEDPRVRAYPNETHSRGMHYWQAAKNLVFRIRSTDKQPLWRIQCLLLSTIFQFGIPIAASDSWILLGGAIRVLLDVGAHRKHTARKLRLSRIEEETYKRVFWVAYSLDRECAACLGRPIMLQDEDLDVELPVEIDDEYLFRTPDSEPLPAQPQDKPALISGFLSSLRLDEIVGRTLKTVYALHKTKVRFGINSKEWDERLVAEIDSALNNWLDMVPPHLRYDPHERNDEWLLQSSLLYSKYYNCQLLVHRPFIPAKKGNSEKSILNFPSLAICTNAARSISHVVANLKERNLHNQIGIPVAFRSVSASTILLMVVWGAKRNGGRVSSSASADLRRSIDVLRAMENHWQFCGKAVDILESIMTSTHVVVPRSGLQTDQGTKRSRDGAEVQDSNAEDEANSSKPTQDEAGAGKQAQRGRSKAEAAHAGSRDGQPLDPEARQLPLSTQQLASLTPQSSNDQSPRSATMDSHQLHAPKTEDGQDALHADPFGPKTPQPTQGARMRTLSGAAGIPASLSFGLMTPPAGAHWGGGVTEADYLNGPHSGTYQAMPAVTPSIFDNFGLGGAGGGVDDMMNATGGSMPDMSQFAFSNDPAAAAAAAAAAGFGGSGNAGDMFDGSLDHFYAATQGNARGGDTPKSDGSGGLANYAFELLQNQSVWNLDADSLNLLQQRSQQHQQQQQRQ